MGLFNRLINESCEPEEVTLIQKPTTTVISKHEPREVSTGNFGWVLVKKLVSIPTGVVQVLNFGWHWGGNPPQPEGDANDPKARVKSMRS